MAEVQKNGGTAALIDAEHAFDSEYSKVREGSTISSQAHAGRAERENEGCRTPHAGRAVHQ